MHYGESLPGSQPGNNLLDGSIDEDNLDDDNEEDDLCVDNQGDDRDVTLSSNIKVYLLTSSQRES